MSHLPALHSVCEHDKCDFPAMGLIQHDYFKHHQDKKRHK